MQSAASVLTDQFSDLLKRLPAGLDLDRLALETKAIRRRREVVDGARLLRITLARGPGGLSLRQTSAVACAQAIDAADIAAALAAASRAAALTVSRAGTLAAFPTAPELATILHDAACSSG